VGGDEDDNLVLSIEHALLSKAMMENKVYTTQDIQKRQVSRTILLKNETARGTRTIVVDTPGLSSIAITPRGEEVPSCSGCTGVPICAI